MSGADGRSSPAGPSGAVGGDQGNGQPKHNFKVISGLTKSQIDQLRQQITIFKKIKRRIRLDFPGYVPRSTTPQLRPHDQRSIPVDTSTPPANAAAEAGRRPGRRPGRGSSGSRDPGRMSCPRGRPARRVLAAVPVQTAARAHTTSRRGTAAWKRIRARRSSTGTRPSRTSATFAPWWRTRPTGSSRRGGSAGSPRSKRNSPRIEDDTTPHAYQQRRRLRVEEKKLRLVELQDSVRAKVVAEQRELMELGDRAYKKLIKEAEKAKELAAKRG